MKTQYIAFFLLLFSTVSCVEEFEADIPHSEDNVLVVEGNIVSGSSSIVYLSYSCSYKSKKKNPLQDAELVLRGSDGTKVKGEKDIQRVIANPFGTRAEEDGDWENGRFLIPTPHLKPDIQYWIEIQDGEHRFQSDPQPPLDAPEIEALKYRQVREDKKVEILVSSVPSHNNDEMVYSSWDFLEAWEIHTPNWTEWEWDNEYGYTKIGHDSYTNVGWKIQNSPFPVTINGKGSVQNATIHTIDHTDDRLQTCYFIRVMNSAISRAEYEYYTTRNQLSNDMGGLFSPMPSELPTNIHCTNGSQRAVGFVGIRGKVNRAELHFLCKDVFYTDTHKKVSPPEEALEGKSPAQLWHEGYRILFYDPLDHSYRWTYAWWVDCRVAPWYASTNMPSFWDPSWTTGTLE